MKLPKNFGMLGMGGLMKQAQEAMQKAQQLEEELAKEKIQIDKGPVKATFTGAGQLESIKIDPSALDPDDIEMLEDLLVSTIREGINTATQMRATRLQQIMPNIPGM
jgi:hypothetical protein